MKKYLSFLVILISVITVASGLTQVVAPGFVLGFIGASISATSMHFFAIVGMFMTLFGGMVLHAIYSAYTNEVAILWASFQKIGAFAAVSLGIIYEIFSPIAAGVALFDLFSGLLFLYYLRSLRNHEVH
ncbi:vacuolar-type H+-ATPase subunit I/STV1 [Catalinimonas alkaloidigena]|uniref:patatin n=1 Tax=Catalinimonas alkaloidigena TaxID=1075417 RepID=UPI00240604F3|nr:patatin [Catalinimonas alkaloidigena]MDF9798626.1 vacuolar-type H+-ATPase subunit I/STV1 [Catalinimonas alkaloidigena]